MYLDNANCAHNAIYASHTMPFIHTMPIMHTMPFSETTQCQLCAQCQICSTFGIVRVHIWHCVAAYLALCDVILYMHKVVVVVPRADNIDRIGIFGNASSQNSFAIGFLPI